jgi:hypothetical protein
MKVAGMMRLSEIDQTKVGKDLMKLSISNLSEYVSHLYFLKIGNIDDDIIKHIHSLNKNIKIINQPRQYDEGWAFKNNESLNDLYKSIDDSFDWILYPDADDLLPENILNLLHEADLINADTVRIYFIECLGSIDDIIEVKPGFPIGPHFKAVKHRANITFINSDGFNEACCNLKRYETSYCMRHLRYATPENTKKRIDMNYSQSYFLENHNTIKYIPMQEFKYYCR